MAAVILQYHHVDSSSPKATSITPEQFRRHMEYLDKSGFDVIDLGTMLNQLRAGKNLPSKSVAISFDDAYESIFQNALPLLKKYGFPSTVFINSKTLGSSGYMNWSQLDEMRVAGAVIANHTHSHPHLLRFLPGETDEQWRRRITEEIMIVEKALKARYGVAPRLLAYPYGEYDGAVQKIVEDLGYIGLAQHSGAIGVDTPLLAVPRFAMGGVYTEMTGFIDKVNSLPMPVSGVKVLNNLGIEITDTVLPAASTKPIIELTFTDASLARRVRCFASGQGALDLIVKQETVSARLSKQLPIGRSRINCTATSGTPGRFYWYSRFFIRKQDSGLWYEE